MPGIFPVLCWCGLLLPILTEVLTSRPLWNQYLLLLASPVCQLHFNPNFKALRIWWYDIISSNYLKWPYNVATLEEAYVQQWTYFGWNDDVVFIWSFLFVSITSVMNNYHTRVILHFYVYNVIPIARKNYENLCSLSTPFLLY